MIMPVDGCKSQYVFLLEPAHLVPVCNDRMRTLLVTHTGGGEQKHITPELLALLLTYCCGAKNANVPSSPSLNHPQHSSMTLSSSTVNVYYCASIAKNAAWHVLEKTVLSLMHSSPPKALSSPYNIKLSSTVEPCRTFWAGPAHGCALTPMYSQSDLFQYICLKNVIMTSSDIYFYWGMLEF